MHITIGKIYQLLEAAGRTPYKPINYTTVALLLGLSKGNARVEILASFFFPVQSQIAVKSLSRLRNILTLTYTRPFD